PGTRDRDGDATRADSEFDDRAARTLRLVDVEGDVLGDAAAPRVVDVSDRVVRAAGRTRRSLHRCSRTVTHGHSFPGYREPGGRHAAGPGAGRGPRGRGRSSAR